MPTKIEWAEETWNPITGCTPISPGCAHCYAARMAKRLAGRFGYPADDPFRVTLHPSRLDEPLQWKKPRRVFVCSMSDFFHVDVPLGFQCRILQVIGKCPQHTFMILTKRTDQLEMWNDVCGWHPYPNLWLGMTVEDQKRANERIPILLKVPAVVHFVSVEPMLGPVDIRQWLYTCPACGARPGQDWRFNGRRYECPHDYPVGHIESVPSPLLDWVICGAETGPGKRPVNLNWARDLRDQCIDANVPLFFKRDSDGKRLLDGREWNEYPGEGE